MGGGIGEMKEILFQIFAMVPLRIAETVGPLLENRILTIPQCKGETETTLLITDTKQTILSPAVSP